MTSYLQEQLRRAISDGWPKPLVICGAGVSTQATNRAAPNWPSLIKSGIERVANLDSNAMSWAADSIKKLSVSDQKEWIAIADELTDRLGGVDNAEFKRWLGDSVGGLVPSDRDLVDAIISLGCPVATTNYDDILTSASGRPPILWSEHENTVEFLNEKRSGILHLHGHWQTPQSVVLGSRSYDAHSSDDRRKLLQSFAALNRPSIFIGCSQEGLSDPDFSSFDEFIAAWKGSAERRYWLVRQDVDPDGSLKALPSPDHNRRLLPVAFGQTYESLAPFLRDLSPPSAVDAASLEKVRCIEQYEPKPQIFGRANELERIVTALLRDEVAIVAGGPGMGKTAVATAALYDDRIVAKYNRYRTFVSLEADSEPRALLVRLVDALGLSSSGDEASLLRVLELYSAVRPIVAVLDNAETIFDSNRSEATRLLNLAAQLRGLAVVLTLRGTPPIVPNSTTIGDLAKLDATASSEAFCAIAGADAVNDSNLPALLQVLDGHALSIHLVAAQVTDGRSLGDMRRGWEEEHAAILSRGGEKETRLTSVRVSLALTLSGKKIKSMPLARRLLALLSYLPGGLAEENVRHLLGSQALVSKAKARDAVTCLRQVRLVEPRLDGHLRLLTPVRESIKMDVSLFGDDRKRLFDRYLSLAAKGDLIGMDRWGSVRLELESEVDNLDSVCELALDYIPERLLFWNALSGLKELHRFSGIGSVRALDRALEFFGSRSQSLQAASVHYWISQIASLRSDTKRAALHCGKALGEFQSLEHKGGQINCLHALGELSFLDSKYSNAADYFNASLDLAKANEDLLGEANALQGLGRIAKAKADPVTGSRYLKESMTLYRQVGDLLGEANCKMGLGEIALSRSNHMAAQTYFRESLPTFERIGEVLGPKTVAHLEGVIALRKFDQSAALRFFSRALFLARRIGNLRGEAQTVVELGELAVQRFDLPAAESHFDEARNLLGRLGNRDWYGYFDKRQGEIALRQKRFQPAAAFFETASNFLSEASTSGQRAELMIRTGQAQVGCGDKEGGMENIRIGFSSFFSTADEEDLALPGWRTLHQLLMEEEPRRMDALRAQIRELWGAIGRLDLVQDWISDWPLDCDA